MDISKGQRTPISQLVTGQTFHLAVSTVGALIVDISCFGLDAQQKLSDERYMTFFNQPKTPCGGVVIVPSTGKDTATFQFNLALLPNSIDRLVITAAIDGTGTMNQLREGSYLRFMANGQESSRFNFSGQDFSQEKALMLGELYRKNGEWRFCAVAQGFNGGLEALVKHFGGSVAAPASAPPESAKPTPPAAKVSLSKVTLDKPNQQHKLSLSKSTHESLQIEATWVDNGDDSDDNDDLDLRVGLLLPDGKMYMVHAPSACGSLTSFPYVYHFGDIRTASAFQPSTEKVEVNPLIAQHMGGRVALVFSVYSAISNGMVSIASLKPKMTMRYQQQIIECVFNPTVSPQAKRQDIYTYVIGLAIIDKDSVTLSYSGVTSQPSSEATPRLQWQKDGSVKIYMDGEPFFKD